VKTIKCFVFFNLLTHYDKKAKLKKKEESFIEEPIDEKKKLQTEDDMLTHGKLLMIPMDVSIEMDLMKPMHVLL
jgi:hypothetical protein